PVHGHGSQEPAAFRQLKETDLHFVDDPEVNLTDIALTHWLAVEGVMKVSPAGSSNSQGLLLCLAKKMEYTHCLTQIKRTQNHLLHEKLAKALQDIKSNPNLVPILSYLISFVVNGMKNLSHDLGHLTTMLNTVRALLHNKSLYLMHKPYLSTIVQGVEFCVLEPLAASINVLNDHWVLRDYAARLLAEIVNRWNSPQNHLRFNTVKCLKDVLLDTTKPFYSHYGAIMTLVAMGHKTIEDVVLQHLPQYWPHLQAAMEDTSSENAVARSDSHKVHGALRLAAEKVLRRNIKKFEEYSVCCKEQNELPQPVSQPESMEDLSEDIKPGASHSDIIKERTIVELYMSLNEYFGDSLAHCLPLVETHHVFKPIKNDDLVKLGDENTSKSGEELLDNLMEQIKMEEKLEQERKERELLQQKEKEKRERERQARQIIEQKKREEEERKRKLKLDEEEQRRKRQCLEKVDEQKKVRDEDKRHKEWAEQMKELNKNRSKPQWQQEIKLRSLQLEEEMQYSRMLEAKKRQERKDLARLEEEKEKLRKQKLEEEELRRKEEEDELAGRCRVGLRRRKPVNYTEKDEDISDLFEDSKVKNKKGALPPRLTSGLPHHSDISDDSDGDLARRLAAGSLSPASAEAGAFSKVFDPSKGLLKLKIKLPAHSSTPPHPMSATPQHIPSTYHSPSMTSPAYSPISATHSTPPPPHATSQSRSKSSSGSEKESKHKKPGCSKQHRTGSTSLPDVSDSEEQPFVEQQQSALPLHLHSPGCESSGSDSNPHRKALKLKLKLTPKDSASE
ncbi:unnamed protein product, partial [Candidula unifasciata]